MTEGEKKSGSTAEQPHWASTLIVMGRQHLAIRLLAHTDAAAPCSPCPGVLRRLRLWLAAERVAPCQELPVGGDRLVCCCCTDSTYARAGSVVCDGVRKEAYAVKVISLMSMHGVNGTM